MKVLLVEDEGITRMWLEDLILEWGYEVIPAATGAKALEQLAQIDSPVVILLDWQLPGISGIEVCRRVKSDPLRSRRTYVIMLTGKTEPHERATALAVGADDFANKPFEPDDVKTRLAKGAQILASVK